MIPLVRELSSPGVCLLGSSAAEEDQAGVVRGGTRQGRPCSSPHLDRRRLFGGKPWAVGPRSSEKDCGGGFGLIHLGGGVRPPEAIERFVRPDASRNLGSLWLE